MHVSEIPARANTIVIVNMDVGNFFFKEVSIFPQGFRVTSASQIRVAYIKGNLKIEGVHITNNF